MSWVKIFLTGALVLFAAIGITALVKKGRNAEAAVGSTQPLAMVASPSSVRVEQPLPNSPIQSIHDDFPMIDRIYQLFTSSPSKLPIVETITYSSSTPWLKGRPAWIADYAVHYGTSRHFIARSLNGKPDYFTQKVWEGKKFNVFRQDKPVEFYLLVDLARLKMGLYYVDLTTNERVLLKTYKIGAGRLDPTRPSGCLTPLGRFPLGEKVAIYQPGTMSYFQEQQVELIQILGSRWIPFGQDVLKGYGIYGAPWLPEQQRDGLIEQRQCIGKYETDGGIRLFSEDLEELFAIVITKPTFIDIVRDFHDAQLPGIEVAAPKP